MGQTLAKFLEFRGKRLSVLSADGQWWVAIKPICEALNVKYESQFERLQTHNIFGQLFRKRGMVAADNRLREMVCLPEKFIYGWLLTINSDSPELIEYQLDCYEILYNHFHGTLTGRMTTLNERSAIDLRILELEEKMKESEEYQEILDLKKRKIFTTKRLKELDTELIGSQLSLALS